MIYKDKDEKLTPFISQDGDGEEGTKEEDEESVE